MKYFNPEIETASRDELYHLQSYRLIKTVKHAYEHVALYRRRFDELGIHPDDIKSVDDLVKLPFTVKQDLRDNYPYGMFAVPREELCRVHASSGTTGKQTVVGYTKHDIEIWSECAARALVAAGADRDDFIHIAYGYGIFTGGLGIHYGAEKLGATVIPASTGNTKRQITMMQDFGSSVLCCTPSYALYISDILEQENIPLSSLHLKTGIFGAEPWSENMRAALEKRLGIKAHDIYGLSEISGPGVAFDCECQNGLHVNEDNFIVEIVDPETGLPVPDGTPGEVVFTCITKEALPLIRYNTHDISTLSRERCGCGRTFARLGKITGRSDDMLIIRGVNVFPSQIESVLLSVGQSNPHYMIVIDRAGSLDTCEIRIEMNAATFSDNVRGIEELSKKIKNSLDSVLGIAAKVTFVEANSLPRTDGKSVHVIDNRKI